MIKRLVLCVGCIMTLILGKLEVNAMTKDSKQLNEYFNNGAPITTQVGAYNTYVGARYVPIFCGEWDANNTYEPLSIVTNEGNSYTSRGYVPKGVPITNGTYWALTGNFNGQLASVQENVNTNTNSITELTEQLDNLTPVVNNTASAVSKIEKYVPPVNNNFSERYWLFYGDSFGVNLGDVTKAWPYVVASNMGLTSSQWSNISQGSIGFSFPLTDDHSVYWDWNNKVNALPKNVTDIVIQMGANDLANISSVYNNAVTTLKKIRSDYPYANIWLCMAGYNFTQAYNYSNLDRIYWQAGLQANVKFIPRAYWSWAGSNMHQSDGVHPTNAGEQSLGNYLTGQLINSTEYIMPVDMPLTFVPAEGVNASCRLTQFVSSMGVYLYGNMTLNNVSAGVLGEFTTPPLRGRFEFIAENHDFSINNGKLRLETGESGVSYNNNAFFIPLLN